MARVAIALACGVSVSAGTGDGTRRDGRRGRWKGWNASVPAATGQWQRSGENYPEDLAFASAVARFLVQEQAANVLDVGSGSGYIARAVALEGRLRVLGVDGNPAASSEPQVFGGGGQFEYKQLDVHLPFPGEVGHFDWVISFAVAEHVPFHYEHLFLANLERAAGQGVLLVWDRRGSEGTGHVNCRDEPEVLRLFDFLGFDVDEATTSALRAAATLRWYQLVLVLRRRPVVASSSGQAGLPGAGNCWESDSAMQLCWLHGLRRLQAIAEVALQEHKRACWPPGWDTMQTQCCAHGGIWAPQVEDRHPIKCFGEGFFPEVCCALPEAYYMQWVPEVPDVPPPQAG